MALGIAEYATSFEAQLLLTAAIAFGAAFVAYGVRRGRPRVADRFSSILVDVVASGISVGVMMLAVVLVASIWGQTETLTEEFGRLRIEERAPQIAVTVVVVIAVQVFSSVASRLLDDITRESDAMSEHEREISYRVTQLLLWVVGLIVILGVWEVNLGGLLVGAGFLGIVMGLAAQQTLGSLLAGFTLMFSRPFEVGDWIVVGEGQAEREGVVTDITMMNTRIQAFNGEFVVVPNDVISGQTVRNRSRKGRLRMEIEVGVDYATDVDRARELAKEAVGDVDMIMDVPRPECVTKSFDDSSVTLAARGWIEHPSSRRRWRATTRMVHAIKRSFAEEGIKIPFPQRELSGRREQGGFRVTGPEREATPASEDDESAESASGDGAPGAEVGTRDDAPEESTDDGAHPDGTLGDTPERAEARWPDGPPGDEE